MNQDSDTKSPRPTARQRGGTLSRQMRTASAAMLAVGVAILLVMARSLSDRSGSIQRPAVKPQASLAGAREAGTSPVVLSPPSPEARQAMPAASDGEIGSKGSPRVDGMTSGAGRAASDGASGESSPALPLASAEASSADSERAGELAAIYRKLAGNNSEQVRASREAVASEMAALPGPEGYKALLELLAGTQDPTARVELLRALASSSGRETEASSQAIADAAAASYGSAGTDERLSWQDALSENPSEAALALLRQAWKGVGADGLASGYAAEEPRERLQAMEALMRASARRPDLVSEQEIAQLTADLKVEAQAAEGVDSEAQVMAIMGLAGYPGNKPFFQELLAKATDPAARALLQKLTN